ncbi:ABC transporter ATP-binding protein [Streptomyces tauricus]|uniref:ABC transporter ATP-binding protein n=1 Tax=Streptomyces tauricus TaxID=68274 RepID=UPI00382FBE85
MTGTSSNLRSELVSRHRGRIVRATALSAASQCADTSVYLLFGRAMSIVMRGESKALAARGLDSAAKQLWATIGTAATARIIAAALNYRAEMTWRGLGHDIEHEWRTELYPHVEHLELNRLEEERATRLSGVVGEDIAQLGNFLATTPHEVTQLATSVTLMAVAYLACAPQAAWVAFLPLPLIAWISLRHQERSSTVYTTSGHDRAQLTSQLVNSLQANATVKSFCGEDHEAQRVEGLSAACRRSDRATDRYTVRYTQTVLSLTAASFLANLLVSGREAMDGTLSLDAFSMFTVLPQQTIFKLTSLGATMDKYQRALQALHRVEYLHSLPTEPVGTGRRLTTDQVSGDITLENVTFSYPGRPPAVRNLSLHFPAGTTTGIVGVTGAGKSTIAKLLTRFHTPQTGRILLDGQDIQSLDITDLRHAVGFVAQDAFLFDGTIDDNLRYGTFDADQDALSHAARLAEAAAFIDTLPNRYRTAVGERGTTLSGGQKQRIALARTFLKNPPVLILDEATSAVDNETEAAIQRALAGFATGRTAIVIAHRLPTVRHADQIYVLDEGGVLVEAGTHEELLAHRGLYASLWALQTHEAPKPAPAAAQASPADADTSPAKEPCT